MDLKSFGEWLMHQGTRFAKKTLYDDLPDGDHPLANFSAPSFSSMLPYRSWDSVTQLYQMETTAGLVMEVDPLGGLDETNTKILGQIFGDVLPDNCHVQILNWSSPKVGFKLFRWEVARAARGGIFTKLARSRREHLSKGVWTSISKSAPYHLRDYRVILAFELKGYVDGEAGDKLRALRATVQSTLMSLGSSSIVLDPPAFLDFVRSVLNPTASLFSEVRDYDNGRPLNQQVISKDTSYRVFEDRIHTSSWNSGDPFEEADGPRLTAGDNRFEYRAFAVEVFPRECDQNRINALLGDLFNGQLQPKGSNLTVLYFHNASYAESKAKVEVKAIRTNQQATSPMAKLNPVVGKVAADWNMVNEAIASGARLSRMMMFTLQLSPRGQGADDERYLRSVALNAGFMIERCNNLQLPYLMAAMPLTMGQGAMEEFDDKLKRMRTMPSNVLPLLAPMQGEPTGFRSPDLLYAGRRGQLFFWGPFSNEGEGNHNTAIVGASGSGKSVTMLEISTALYGAGDHIIVFDDGASFKNTCLLLDGQHIDFDLNANICINPFSMVNFEEAVRDLEYASDCKSGIVDLVLQMARGDEKPTPIERGVVSNAVNHVWEIKGFAGRIHDVAIFLRDHEGELGSNLFKSMTDYLEGGQYYELFNGRCNVAVNNEYTVFELSPLESKPLLRAVVVLALLMIVAQRMKFVDRRIRKGLIIDEAWKLLADGAAGDFIDGFSRRCRKMGGALITGTQSLEDYERTAGSRACILNSDHQIIMRLKPESIARFRASETLRVSDAEIRILESLRTSRDEYSEAYIRSPNARVVGRLILDPFSIALFDTRPATWAAVQERIKGGLSVEDAVYSVAYKQPAPGVEGEDQNQSVAEILALYPEVKRFARHYVGLPEAAQRRFIDLIYNRLEGLNDAA